MKDKILFFGLLALVISTSGCINMTGEGVIIEKKMCLIVNRIERARTIPLVDAKDSYILLPCEKYEPFPEKPVDKPYLLDEANVFLYDRFTNAVYEPGEERILKKVMITNAQFDDRTIVDFEKIEVIYTSRDCSINPDGTIGGDRANLCSAGMDEAVEDINICEAQLIDYLRDDCYFYVSRINLDLTSCEKVQNQKQREECTRYINAKTN